MDRTADNTCSLLSEICDIRERRLSQQAKEISINQNFPIGKQ